MDCRSNPMIRRILHPLLRLHRDDRGNLGILLLIIVMLLVGLIGMVWNTGEVAAKRQQMQSAADAAAHSAATWTSRCINLMAAQNMLICQDASEQTIWQAIPPTDERVRRRLERETADAQRALDNNDASLANLRNRIIDQLRAVDDEYQMARGAWADVNARSGQAFADVQAGQQFRISVRQAGEVLDWVQNTYVGGQASPVAGRPGPPGPAGEGLRTLVQKWAPPPDVAPLFQAILASLQLQIAVLVQFETRTAPALSQNVPAIVAAHQAEVFNTQQEILDQVATTVQEQISRHADFYKAEITLATPGPGAQAGGLAAVQVPVLRADDPVLRLTTMHYDSIRRVYVDIDPINVHTDAVPEDTFPPPAIPGPSPLDARIWHPDVEAPVPADIVAQYPGVRPSFTIGCSIRGGWGHSYGAPIKRYFNARVWNDQQGLRTYMAQIDDLRRQLAELLRQMRGLPANDNIAALPAQIRDSQADPQGNFPMIAVLPRLSAPADATDELRAAITLYNQHAAAYTGAVRGLAGSLRNWTRFFDRFTEPFAGDVWHGQVDAARAEILRQLGLSKQFMVVNSYRLRPIPAWAASGMRVSAQASIQDRIVQMNIGGVGRSVLNTLVADDPLGLGGGFLDPAARTQVLQAQYSSLASQIAFRIVTATAREVAPIIAAEWVSRPWAYELTPPEMSVPPSRGLSKQDRLDFYTLLTAARPTASTSPRLVLGQLLGMSNPSLLAYAQAETFNWMEYHDSYGGSERFDEVTYDPDSLFVGAPNPWRLCTIGGWNWQPRLAVADGLAPALDNNPELNTFFTEGGVSGHDANDIDTITLH